MIGERWAGVPVAWAAVAENGQPLWLAYDRPADATAVPLYRHSQPTLTDAEREAVEVAAEAYADDHGERFAATLRGLLDRTQ
jgi:hypothetical protein